MLLLGILFLLTSDASVSLDSLDLGDLTCCFLLGGVLKPDAYKRPEVTAKPTAVVTIPTHAVSVQKLGLDPKHSPCEKPVLSK